MAGRWSALVTDVPLAFSSAAVSSRIWHKAVITSGLMYRSYSSSTAAVSCIAVSWPASACFRLLLARGHVMRSRPVPQPYSQAPSVPVLSSLGTT